MEFVDRHIGPRKEDISIMLKQLGVKSLDELIQKTIPTAIRSKGDLDLPPGLSEEVMLSELREKALQNEVWRSYIGLGYYGTHTPPVIQRNILENPGWYTQYTPYQAEISQGRLEALLNFQTMICDLTGMEVANASLLDEGTAAAEAMALAYRARGQEKRNTFLVSETLHPQTIDVVRTRAEPLGIEVKVFDPHVTKIEDSVFGVMVQYPDTNGEIIDYSNLSSAIGAQKALFIVATDLLALTLLKPPGQWGADIVLGNSQRFGVPLGFGGPHAAFFAVKDEFKRSMPGRLIGVSKDGSGNLGYRLALQTREQHIRREKATSNICTSQVLLAIMASMYAVYHGPEGLKEIAQRAHKNTAKLKASCEKVGLKIKNEVFFDSITLDPGSKRQEILERARAAKINLNETRTDTLGISLDETVGASDLKVLVKVLTGQDTVSEEVKEIIPSELNRLTPYLTHPVFNLYHSETEFLRYVTRLQSKDLSLANSMIPLGSCTMKLNATAEMVPVTWSEFGALHPFVPLSQAKGYLAMIRELEEMLATITGFDAVSLQPNAGSQGEYAGLLAIRAYHQSKGEGERNVCLIPMSAHGTNPASAALAGMVVVPVQCDDKGNVNLADLERRSEEHSSKLSALMVTYPSTHGVFEEGIVEACRIAHKHGAQVYMDGANLNAQVGLTAPNVIGADVCHINLHKTFCIPHGGGGPGMGPIAVKKHLAGFLPGHRFSNLERKVGAVSAAPWGSTSILPISWAYIKLMGGVGLKKATECAILNANYIAKVLSPYYPVLYSGHNGTVAHECILDLREIKKRSGVEVEDVAKRLMDYGFHAPTVSFPVPGTLMVEPTESESKAELDRFCEAMISIRAEIKEIEDGKMPQTNNLLKNAPHTAEILVSENWSRPYTRERAAFPVPSLKNYKFWPPIGRIDNVYGDKNLVCTCGPMTDYV